MADASHRIQPALFEMSFIGYGAAGIGMAALVALLVPWMRRMAPQ